jgi:2-hydroxychromene-2-carboxylate isomerase
MPFLLKQRLLPLDDTLDFHDFKVSETTRTRQRYGIEPKFGIMFTPLNVDMRRFLPLQAEKEESITFIP